MYFGIIADDLTGAADTGIQFAKQNFYTILLPFGLENALFHSYDVISQAGTTGSIEDPHYLRETQVIAVSTNSRGMQAEQAYDTVRNATEHLKRIHSQIIYKKIDSTLRGNLGIEIEAVLDISGNDFAILAPAFPAYNRTTIGGIHFVNGKPLSQIEVASDLVRPVGESNIPVLIRAQTRLKVGHITLEEVCRGSESLKRSIFEHLNNGEKIIVFDAVTNADLSNIAEAGMSMPSFPLMVGSAGLAVHLSKFLTQREHIKGHPPIYRMGHEGVVIVISGSLSAVTSRQLDTVRETRRGKIISVDIRKLIEDCESGSKRLSEIVSEIMLSMKTNRVAGIQSINTGIHDGRGMEFSKQVVEYLGRVALQIVNNYSQTVRGMILSGGDTALAVFEYLKISRVRLINEILPGVPYGRVMDGKFTGLTIVTKAGSFGDESTLVKCIDFLIGVR
jgi:uncharacterized protein YgbK (DUF1537 family)